MDRSGLPQWCHICGRRAIAPMVTRVSNGRGGKIPVYECFYHLNYFSRGRTCGHPDCDRPGKSTLPSPLLIQANFAIAVPDETPRRVHREPQRRPTTPPTDTDVVSEHDTDSSDGDAGDGPDDGGGGDDGGDGANNGGGADRGGMSTTESEAEMTSQERMQALAACRGQRQQPSQGSGKSVSSVPCCLLLTTCHRLFCCSCRRSISTPSHWNIKPLPWKVPAHISRRRPATSRQSSQHSPHPSGFFLVSPARRPIFQWTQPRGCQRCLFGSRPHP